METLKKKKDFKYATARIKESCVHTIHLKHSSSPTPPLPPVLGTVVIKGAENCSFVKDKLQSQNWWVGIVL